MDKQPSRGKDTTIMRMLAAEVGESSKVMANCTGIEPVVFWCCNEAIPGCSVERSTVAGIWPSIRVAGDKKTHAQDFSA